MGFDEWLLALHVLAAFALGAAMVLFWVMIVTMRRSPTPDVVVATARLGPIGTIVVGVGTLGTLVLGIWLAIALDEVKLWDAWVIAAIVLWAIGTETGRRGGNEYRAAATRAAELTTAGSTGPDAELTRLARTSRGLMLHTVSSLAVVLVLIDMIWKPGA